MDSKRNELLSGSIGKIAIRSQSLFTGNRNYPEKTKEAMMDDWYLSGDLGFEIEEIFTLLAEK
jgi:acyl-CoA synthetase (AMP-forming)/AMP-acid ligase II